MSKRGSAVPRPQKKTEYAIRFASKQAADGWRNVCSTQLSKAADAWDWLTKNPTKVAQVNGPMKGPLRWLDYDGDRHERWQHELANGARIWFFVVGQVVHLERVHTRHPNATK